MPAEPIEPKEQEPLNFFSDIPATANANLFGKIPVFAVKKPKPVGVREREREKERERERERDAMTYIHNTLHEHV